MTKLVNTCSLDEKTGDETMEGGRMKPFKALKPNPRTGARLQLTQKVTKLLSSATKQTCFDLASVISGQGRKWNGMVTVLQCCQMFF
jgi:hypothetical protein